MADVILFQPSTGFYDDLVKSIPLGLLAISRYLVQEDYKVKIIDQRIDKKWKKNLLKELDKHPLCFGTTSTTGQQIITAINVSKIVKENSEVKLVWGGNHPSLLPKQTLANEYIDIVLVGEADYSFCNLVKCIESGKSLGGVNGIYYKHNGKIIENPPEALLDLNSMPSLPYELIDINSYSNFSYGRDILMETSRGCPYSCTFCYEPGFNRRKWRSLTAENVIKNIKFVVDKFKVNDICFSDSNFFVDVERINKIVDWIIEEDINIRWNCQTSLNFLTKYDDEWLTKIEKSGLKWLEIGVESGSQRILDTIYKNMVTPNQIIDFNRKLKNFSNIIPKYNFITGFPTETDEDLKKTTNLILKLLKENPTAIIQALFSATPYPGTEFYDESIKNGFIPPSKLEDWAKFDPMEWISNIPWLDKNRIKRLKLLYFSSLFIDNKLDIHKKSFILEFFEKLYKPIGMYRFKTHSTFLQFELPLLNSYLHIQKVFRGIKLI